jgi:hypothetical protein
MEGIELGLWCVIGAELAGDSSCIVDRELGIEGIVEGIFEKMLLVRSFCSGLHLQLVFSRE